MASVDQRVAGGDGVADTEGGPDRWRWRRSRSSSMTSSCISEKLCTSSMATAPGTADRLVGADGRRRQQGQRGPHVLAAAAARPDGRRRRSSRGGTRRRGAARATGGRRLGAQRRQDGRARTESRAAGGRSIRPPLPRRSDGRSVGDEGGAAAACPLRTAPSIVAGQPVSVHAPAKVEPGDPRPGAGAVRGATGHGPERGVPLLGDAAVEHRAAGRRGSNSPRAPTIWRRASGRVARSLVGGRKRDGQVLPAAWRPAGAVRSNTNCTGAVDDGGEGEVGDPAVEHEVHVDDRRRCRARRIGSTPGARAPGGSERRGDVGGRPPDDGVGGRAGPSAVQHDDRRRVGQRSHSTAVPSHDLDAGPASAAAAEVAVRPRRAARRTSRCRRHRRGRAGRCGTPSRRAPATRLVGRQVQGRAGDEIPERRRSPARLAVLGQPRAERDEVVRPVVGIDRSQAACRQHGPHRRAAGANGPVARAAAGEVQRCRQAGPCDPSRAGAPGTGRARPSAAWSVTISAPPIRSTNARYDVQQRMNTC